MFERVVCAAGNWTPPAFFSAPSAKRVAQYERPKLIPAQFRFGVFYTKKSSKQVPKIRGCSQPPLLNYPGIKLFAYCLWKALGERVVPAHRKLRRIQIQFSVAAVRHPRGLDTATYKDFKYEHGNQRQPYANSGNAQKRCYEAVHTVVAGPWCVIICVCGYT